MSMFHLGSSVALGIGGRAGAITGTALAGAGEIVGAATGGAKGAEGASSKGGGKAQAALALAQKLLESLSQAQSPQGAQEILKELQALGRSNPDALAQGLRANPAAAGALGGGAPGQ